MKKSSPLKFTLALFYLILSYGIFFLFDNKTVIYLTKEDGIIEWLGAIYLLVTSFIFIIFFIKKSDGNDFYFIKTNRNYFFLILGILFLFGFFEEISWGQRILDVQSPEIFTENNYQNETNIHNLKIFTGFFSANRLFTLFWMGFCVIIPLLYLSSPKIANFIKKINFPVVPLWLTFLFIIQYIVFLIPRLNLNPTDHFAILRSLIEIKETSISFLFVILSISFYMKKHNQVAINS